MTKKNKATKISCPSCGAPFSMLEGHCEYCGSYLERYSGPRLPTKKLAPVTYVATNNAYNKMYTYSTCFVFDDHKSYG